MKFYIYKFSIPNVGDLSYRVISVDKPGEELKNLFTHHGRSKKLISFEEVSEKELLNHKNYDETLIDTAYFPGNDKELKAFVSKTKLGNINKFKKFFKD